MRENYLAFWEVFTETSLYKRIRKSSLTDSSICLLLMEFYNSLQNAQNLQANLSSIQKYINIIFMVFEHNEKDKKEFVNCLELFGLDSHFNIPDKSFIQKNFYDKESNTIIQNKPFQSWLLHEGKWIPPVEYPKDGNIYIWSEETLSWIERTL